MPAKLNDKWYNYCYPSLINEEKWKKLIPDELRPTGDSVLKNIYYVNGLWNEFERARKFTSAIQKKFDDDEENVEKTNVRLVYNEHEGKIADLVEAMLDKIWVRGKPILNPTTITLISILYNAYTNKKEIGIIGHSQGTLITYNAIIEFSKLGNKHEEFLKNNVRVFLCSPMITKASLSKIKKLVHFDYYTNPKDHLPDYVNSLLAKITIVYVEGLLTKIFGSDINKVLVVKALVKLKDMVGRKLEKTEEWKKAAKEETENADKDSMFYYHDFLNGYIGKITKNFFKQ